MSEMFDVGVDVSGTAEEPLSGTVYGFPVRWIALGVVLLIAGWWFL